MSLISPRTHRRWSASLRLAARSPKLEARLEPKAMAAVCDMQVYRDCNFDVNHCESVRRFRLSRDEGEDQRRFRLPRELDRRHGQTPTRSDPAAAVVREPCALHDR